MSVNLVILKSGEEIVADVKEIKSEGNVVGYFFDNPLTIHCESDAPPEILLEGKTETQYSSKIKLSFFPWIPLSAERKNIPCSADWIVTIVKPQEQLIKLYEEKVNGRNESEQSSIIN